MKVLYILPSYNLFGGTPKKTLDLMNYFGSESILYVYENNFCEFKDDFIKTGGMLFEGYHGRNIFMHIRNLLEIIDAEGVNIIQTQFSMGEFLAYLIKKFRPNIKVIIAFVSAIKPSLIKSFFLQHIYINIDSFVFISEYVKKEKLHQFPKLLKKNCNVIYNGSKIRIDTGLETRDMSKKSILAISGLIELKNISVLIEAFNIIVNKFNRRDIKLFVAGDGPKKDDLMQLISKYKLGEFICLLGYQKNVGRLLKNSTVFVHPSTNEGFGIVVVEAMLCEKPIIVSNAGALPEIIDNEVNGLVVDAFDPSEWAFAILKLLDSKEFSERVSKNAKTKATSIFSFEQFVTNYELLYNRILSK
jgi:L-malate glycosyltransferase